MGVQLSVLGTFETGIFDESAAEIVAFDSGSDRLFVINANDGIVDVLDISDPNNPTEEAFELNPAADIEDPEGGEIDGINSVAVSNGLVAVAVEVVNAADNDAQEPGLVAFYDTDGVFLNSVEVGFLPDSVTFTPDGNTVLVANEGEPDDDIVDGAFEFDPEGSISIIDVSGGVETATVTTADFTAFNDDAEALIASGVRIFGPGATVAQDLEPEFITVTDDSTTAFVALQENNALAVVDIATSTVTDILPLGVIDNNPTPTLEVTLIDDASVPLLGVTESGQEIPFGAFSSLFFEGVNPENGNLQFLTNPDAGPSTGENEDGEQVFLLPDFQPQVVRFEFNPSTGDVEFTDFIPLTGIDGAPLTGIPNIAADDIPVDEAGNPIPFDPDGADLEGIVVAPDGTFWMVDEFRPSIYHFNPDGTLIDRFIPDVGLGPEFGTPALPAIYAQRTEGRGFEAIALQDGLIYAFVQSPLDNPDTDESIAVRILQFDPATSTTIGEFIYILEGGESDRIGDAVALGPEGEFLLIERDDDTNDTGDGPEQAIFRINLENATNTLDFDLSTLPDGETIESIADFDLTTAEATAALEAVGITPVFKELVADTDELGFGFANAPEGLAQIDATTFAIINDNDYGLEGLPTGIGILELGNALDASDEDGAINIRNWPIFSLNQPDSIDTLTIDGETFIVTANEGDSRDFEVERVEDLILDPVAFPDAATLQLPDQLGRLEVTTTLGDTDGDGDFDQLFAFGSRSFSIFDTAGNLVFNSGSLLEEITAELLPDNFNTDNDENGFDDRSDDAGPEPEAITVGEVDGVPHIFVGLERIGGIAVFDASDPTSPEFVEYFNNRDFSAPIEEAGDLGPEGFAFIPAEESPNGEAILAVGNEVSGTTSLFQVDDVAPVFTLQLLHASDLEGGINAIGSAPNFAAIVSALEPEFENTITLSAGDNYISGPFFNAASDSTVFNSIFEGLYNTFPFFDVDGDGTPEPLLDVSGIPDSADTNGNSFFDIDEIDAFLTGPDAGDLTAEDVFVTDINGDGFPDYFDEIDNFQGRVDISIMNLIGFDASALGNHEFDLGTDNIENIIEFDSEEDNSLSDVDEESVLAAFPGAVNFLQEVDWLGAQFPYLSSNLDFSADTQIGNLFTDDILFSTDFESDLLSARTDVNDPTITGPNDSQDRIAPSTVIDVNGELIGVVGATTPLLEAISSPGVVEVLPPSDLTEDLAEIIQVEVDELLAFDDGTGRVLDKVVLVSHLQQFSIESQELAPLLSGVDIIVAGGSGQIVADAEDIERGLQPGDTIEDLADIDLDTPGQQIGYPFVATDADGNPVAVVSTDEEYSYVGRLVIDFDANGIIIPESVDPNVSGAFATTDEGVADLFGDEDPFADGTPQAAVQDLVNNVTGVVTSLDGNIQGQSDVFQNGARGDVRNQETNFGTLTAEANIFVAREIEDVETSPILVSFKNGGGIRDIIGFLGQLDDGSVVATTTQANPAANKEEGDVSELDIGNTLRFNNGLELITLTSAQLFEVLEHSVAETLPDLTSEPGQFAQVDNIIFSFDATQPARTFDPNTLEQVTPGERIINAAVFDDSIGGFVPVVENGELVDDAPEAIRVVTLDFLEDGGDQYPFPVFEALDPEFYNEVSLIDEFAAAEAGSFPDLSTFETPGSEQDALAELYQAEFNVDNGGSPFDIEDTPVEDDLMIQNDLFREDTIDLFVFSDEPFELIFNSLGDDVVEVGTNMDGENEIIFTGAGLDFVDIAINGPLPTGGNRVYTGSDDDIVLASFDDRIFGGDGSDVISGILGDGDNRLYAGAGDDIIVVGSDDRAFGGDGSDTFDATTSEGGARIYGGAGDDVFLLGAGDRVVGGDGDDLFNVLDGGDNLISGGSGADTFIIADFVNPPDVNTITDLELDVDIISVNFIDGVASVADLTFTPDDDGNGTFVGIGDQDIAFFLGIDAVALETTGNFTFA